jgi:AcrR family transcriptional regulator
MRSSPVPAPRASRLSRERQAEILDTVIDLLRKVGYEALTMDAVAADAHTSKATLYRQWGGRPGLVVAALEQYHVTDAPHVDTGSLRGDLAALIEAQDAESEEDTELMAGLVRAVFTDAELRDVIRTRLLDPGLEMLDRVFERAIARGEVEPDCPALPYIGHLLAAFGLTHHLLRGSPATAADLIGVIDDVLVPALRPSR